MKKFIPEKIFNTALVIIAGLTILIRKFFVITSKVDKLNNKNTIDIDIPLSKFMRPKNFATTNERITIANKFCVIKFDFSELKITVYNKFSEGHFVLNLEEASKTKDDIKIYFDKLIAYFNYQTTYNNLVYFCTNKIQIYFKESKKYTQKNILDINNASSAELIGIPGINAAKANKVLKYLIHNEPFKNTDEFVSFVGMNEENAKQLKKYVDSDCKCDIQKLPFYNNRDNQYKYW